jgi:hypothetical protein
MNVGNQRGLRKGASMAMLVTPVGPTFIEIGSLRVRQSGAWPCL